MVDRGAESAQATGTLNSSAEGFSPLNLYLKSHIYCLLCIYAYVLLIKIKITLKISYFSSTCIKLPIQRNLLNMYKKSPTDQTYVTSCHLFKPNSFAEASCFFKSDQEISIHITYLFQFLCSGYQYLADGYRTPSPPQPATDPGLQRINFFRGKRYQWTFTVCSKVRIEAAGCRKGSSPLSPGDGGATPLRLSQPFSTHGKTLPLVTRYKNKLHGICVSTHGPSYLKYIRRG